MKATPNVLVGWDGSAHADAAVRNAAEWTERLNGRLFVALVWDYLTQPGPWRSQFHAMDATEAVEAAVAALVPASGAVEPVTRLGTARTELLALADDLDADLIVMGQRGATTGLMHLVGSTTTYVVKRARCPVLVVPSLTTEHVDEPAQLRAAKPAPLRG
jgi:nucleotide-binding universal stress UspA family protein